MAEGQEEAGQQPQPPPSKKRGGGAEDSGRDATAPADDAPTMSPSCNRCVVLLRHVLSQTDSLPHQLLQSLTTIHPAGREGDGAKAAAGVSRSATKMATKDSRTSIPANAASSQKEQPMQLVTRPVDGGIQVRIPAEDPAALRRTWRELLQTNEVAATEASVSPTTTTTAAGTVFTNDGEIGSRTSSSKPSPRSSSSSAPLPAPPVPSPLLHRLATSPSRTSETPDRQKHHEWLTFTCRHCSDVGPEGGARAFVMGPNPLSVVVCHNRLLPDRRRTTTTMTTPQQHDPSSSTAPALYSPSSFLFSSASKSSSSSPPSSPNAESSLPLSLLSAAHVNEMNEILSHELSHVYDVRQLMLDLRDCENLAYSEVRAARIAECRTTGREGATDGSPTGGGGGFAAAARGWYLPSYYGSHVGGSNSNNGGTALHQQRSCVRQKAVTATLNLFPHQARSCLNQVFEAAMADHRPILKPLPTKMISTTAKSASVPRTTVGVAESKEGTQSGPTTTPPRYGANPTSNR